MVQGRLICAENKQCLIPKVFRTTNFIERMRGLLFKPPLKTDEALLITSCNSVHMFGMTYPIDLIFLDKNGVILKLVNQLQPWRISSCLKANMVVELPENSLKNMYISNGQQLEWHNES
jgi:uncharacterized protein